MTKYFVFNQNGDQMSEIPLSAQDAATEMLSHDGHRFAVVENDSHTWSLFVTRHSISAMGGDGGLVKWPDYSADTEQGVYENVVRLGGVWDTIAVPEDEQRDSPLAGDT